MLLTDTRSSEKVSALEFFTSFMISVAAGVVAYYICKWPDDHDKSSK